MLRRNFSSHPLARGLPVLRVGRYCSSGGAAATDAAREASQQAQPPPSSGSGSGSDAGSTPSGTSGSGEEAESDAQQRAYKEHLVQELLARDKEVFNLKRINELGFMRVEREQNRTLRLQEDKGLYYEQNTNFETFNTITNTSHQRRIVFNHVFDRRQWRRGRALIFGNLTAWLWLYLFWKYQLNPEFEYFPVGMYSWVQPQFVWRRSEELRTANRNFATEQDEVLRAEERALRDQVRQWKAEQRAEKEAAASAHAAKTEKLRG